MRVLDGRLGWQHHRAPAFEDLPAGRALNMLHWVVVEPLSLEQRQAVTVELTRSDEEWRELWALQAVEAQRREAAEAAAAVREQRESLVALAEFGDVEVF